MDLTFEELESAASEDEIAAEHAVANTTNFVAFTRKRAARQPLPAHVSGERVVEAPHLVPMLRQYAAAEGYHQGGGGDPTPVEGDPARTREVHLPRLREDQP